MPTPHHATTHRFIRSHAGAYPADTWDDDIWYCHYCHIAYPHATCNYVRAGVIAHYRAMLPPPTPHGGQPDPRFTDWPDPPATELGRYCQQILDDGQFP